MSSLFGFILALVFAANAPQFGTVVSVYEHAADVNAACFSQTPDHTTYVSTGDIDAMWLRDSSAQAMSYLRDRALVRGVIARQERMIALDPYANAFRRDYGIAEEKFELDSLSYPVLLVDRYVKATGDTAVFDSKFHGELLHILRVIALEQDHKHQSLYHRNEHPSNSATGLIWSAYRPSDDEQTYNFNIPENMFAAVALRSMADMLNAQYHDQRASAHAMDVAQRIEAAVTRYGIFKTGRGRIYAYEVDGFGHAKFMDDANIPSLLSVPLIGFAYDRSVYAATRNFVLSSANPYFFRGRYAEGIGSAHTPAGYVWPMSLVVQYQTSGVDKERQRVVTELSRSTSGDGALHESFDANDPKKYTRERFGWVNALFDQTFHAHP